MTTQNAQEVKALQEAIETWLAYLDIRSYRKVGKEVHASKSAVEERVNLVTGMLKRGELEYIGGVIKAVKSS